MNRFFPNLRAELENTIIRVLLEMGKTPKFALSSKLITK